MLKHARNFAFVRRVEEQTPAGLPLGKKDRRISRDACAPSDGVGQDDDPVEQADQHHRAHKGCQRHADSANNDEPASAPAKFDKLPENQRINVVIHCFEL